MISNGTWNLTTIALEQGMICREWCRERCPILNGDLWDECGNCVEAAHTHAYSYARQLLESASCNPYRDSEHHDELDTPTDSANHTNRTKRLERPSECGGLSTAQQLHSHEILSPVRLDVRDCEWVDATAWTMSALERAADAGLGPLTQDANETFNFQRQVADELSRVASDDDTHLREFWMVQTESSYWTALVRSSAWTSQAIASTPMGREASLWFASTQRGSSELVSHARPQWSLLLSGRRRWVLSNIEREGLECMSKGPFVPNTHCVPSCTHLRVGKRTNGTNGTSPTNKEILFYDQHVGELMYIPPDWHAASCLLTPSAHALSNPPIE